jgi:hypothetical protein
MALFNKNKKGDMKEMDGIPSLPELPRLPDLPLDSFQYKPNALPKFPSNALGNRFSQSTIKDAISGEKEDEETDESEEEQMMSKLPKGPLTRETMEEDELPMEQESKFSSEFRRETPSKMEPMFVRLDKFEENMDTFEKIKRQFAGVEVLLEGIKGTREEENKELESWQTKLQTMKNQIDKIDRDIFSKIE